MAVQDYLVENADCLVVTMICLCLPLMIYHCSGKIGLSKCKKKMERECTRDRQTDTDRDRQTERERDL